MGRLDRVHWVRIVSVPGAGALVARLAAVLWLVLTPARFGEHLLFIGDNARVAEVVGVNVDARRSAPSVLMGVVAAFASVLLTFENRSFFNTQAAGICSESWRRCSSGGPRCSAARASLVGTVAGSFIIGMVEAGLVRRAAGILGPRRGSVSCSWQRSSGHILIEEPERRSAFVRALRGRFDLVRKSSPGGGSTERRGAR